MPTDSKLARNGVEHKGGGWYEMPDGETVRGKQQALNSLSQHREAGDDVSYKTVMMNQLEYLIDRMESTAGMRHMHVDGEDRDMWEELGYGDPDLSDYREAYERQDIAGRLIDLPTGDTWKKPPTVKSEENDEFQDAFEKMARKTRLWNKLEKVDKMNMLGHYSVLVMGTSDITSFNDFAADVRPDANAKPSEWSSRPFDGVEDLLYVTPFLEKHAEIEEHIDDPGQRKLGMPEMYDVTIGEKDSQEHSLGDLNESFDVHHSRVLHVAEDTLENEVFGRPKLKRVYNRLIDLRKMIGPTAEAFWKEIDPIWQFSIDPDVNVGDDQADEIEKKVLKLINGLQRSYTGQGMDMEKFSAELNDVSNPFDVIVSLICASEGIPKRILLGSERGDLASSQDERNWAGRVHTRQTKFAKPMILNKLVDRCIDYGILPPVDNYTIDFPPLFQLNEKEKAEIRLQNSKAVRNMSSVAESTVAREEKREMLDLPEEMPGQAENMAELEAEDAQFLNGDMGDLAENGSMGRALTT